MKILFLSAEVAPFVSVGGLSQVMLFLPKALAKTGHDPRIFTAKYGSMGKSSPGKKEWPLKMELEGLRVPVDNDGEDDHALICNVKTIQPGKNNLFTYFLENQEYYELRENVFGYKDDHIRFYLLCKGCLEWLTIQYEIRKRSQDKNSVWWPDIIHCNDWHTGYFVDLARSVPRYREVLSKVPILFTVHNFIYQGNYEFKFQDLKEKDDMSKPLLPLFDDNMIKQNPLERGIVYADAVNTVSPTHATEVLTHEYAEGLDDVLIAARGKLSGILNGLDTEEFDPNNDPLVYRNFNSKSFLKERKENKRHLQKLFGLPEDDSAPVIGSSGRVTYQKGWDLILQVMEPLLNCYKKLQFVVLGAGDDYYRQQLMVLQEKYPNQIGLHMRPDFRIPRKIFSGADMLLMPSMFEPGGIVAVESLRYGAVPIVRRTGGLNDTIHEFDPRTGHGNGFSFASKNPSELMIAIVRALTIYEQPQLWRRVVKNALQCDFSWVHAAKEYSTLYKKTLEAKKRANRPTPHPAYLITPK